MLFTDCSSCPSATNSSPSVSTFPWVLCIFSGTPGGRRRDRKQQGVRNNSSGCNHGGGSLFLVLFWCCFWLWCGEGNPILACSPNTNSLVFVCRMWGVSELLLHNHVTISNLLGLPTVVGRAGAGGARPVGRYGAFSFALWCVLFRGVAGGSERSCSCWHSLDGVFLGTCSRDAFHWLILRMARVGGFFV